MTSILNIFVVQAILIVIYFKGFTNADHRCHYCAYNPTDKNRITENYTLHPRGCLSIVNADLQRWIQKADKVKTCTWDITIEAFESYEQVKETKDKPAHKKWRLVAPGMVSALHYQNINKSDTCELLEDVSYRHTTKRQKVFRCYCGTELCNKNYPLCKWLRAADPNLTEPLGCVDDDKFPSDKEPNLYKGQIYVRLDGEEAPQSKPIENVDTTTTPEPTTEKYQQARGLGGQTCADEISEIYDGIKDIQKLLKEEL